MLGSALMGYTYRNVSQFVVGSNNPPVAVLPVDVAGRWFGAFWVKRADMAPADGYPTLSRSANPTAGTRLVVDLRRNSTILATTQIWNKRQWRIEQRWNDSANSRWHNLTTAGGLIQSFNFTPQPPTAPWAFPSPVVTTYGNAYFPPAGWPALTPGTTPKAHSFAIAVHPEPFYVTFDRAADDSIDFMLRAFADRPNSTLGANAINDDAPPADFGVRSAEETIAFDPFGFTEAAYFLDGWLVRIAPTDAEVVTSIPNDPNWGTSGT